MTALFLRCQCGVRITLSETQAGTQETCPTAGCGEAIEIPPLDVMQQLDGCEVTLTQLKQLTQQPESSDSAHVTSIAWEPGKTINGVYRVERQLGEGAFGSVWQIRHLPWQLDMAVKELRQDRTRSRKRQDLFVREANAWVNLGMHPHLTSAWYVDSLGTDNHFLFLEYVAGGNLAEWIRKERTRDIETALDIGIQLCRGLKYCHSRGVVHRDFKPLNVLMTDGGTVKLTDFGTVKFAGMKESAEPERDDVVADVHRTIGGQLQGTPAYMPPEQWVRGGVVDFRADVYAFGVTLFELLTGEFPLSPSEPGLQGWTRAHAHVRPRSVSRYREDVPRGLEQLLDLCLEKNPDARPTSMKHVETALIEIFKQVTSKDYPPSTGESLQLRAESLNNQAVTLHFLGKDRDLNNRDPVQLLQEARRLHPDLPEVIFNQAWLRWKRGEFEPRVALNDLHEGAKRFPDDPRWPQLEGELLAKLGDAGDARIPLRTAERLAADSIAIKEALQALNSREHSMGSFEHCFTPDECRTVAVSPDARYVVVDQKKELVLRCWDLSNTPDGKPREFAKQIGSVNSLAFSPDGRSLLSGGHRLRLWNISDGTCLQELAAGEAGVRVVSFSSDGTVALSGGRDGLRLWDATTDEWQFKALGRQRKVIDATFHPNGRWIASGDGNGDVILWDTERPDKPKKLHSYGEFFALAVSPDGRILLTAGKRKSKVLIDLWEFRTGRRLGKFSCQHSRVNALTFSPAGDLFLSAGGNQVLLWSIAEQTCVRQYTARQGEFNSAVFDLDENKFFTTGTVTGLRMWSIGRGLPGQLHFCPPVNVDQQVKARSRLKSELQVVQGIMKNDPRQAMIRLATLLDESANQSDPQLHDLFFRVGLQGQRTGLLRARLKRSVPHHDQQIRQVVWPAGGKPVVTLTGTDISWWSPDSGQKVGTSQLSLASTAVSSDGQTLARFDPFARTVRLFNLTTGKRLRSIQLAADKGGSLVESVALSSGGQFVAFAKRGRVEVWGGPQGRCLASNSCEGNVVFRHLHFSPDSRLLIGTGFDHVSVYELETGARRVLDHPPSQADVRRDDRRVEGTAFSPDGQRFAVGTSQSGVNLWRVDDQKHEAVLRGFQPPLCFTPDGRFLLCCNSEHAVCVLDIASGKCLQQLHGHEDKIADLTVSPDGRYLLSGSKDHTLNIWELLWDYSFPCRVDRDDQANRLLDIFITLHTPNLDSVAKTISLSGSGGDTRCVIRKGIPIWNEKEEEDLLLRLKYAGLGWVCQDGIRAMLKQLAYDRHQD